jgi:FtsZ-interacting cell division protein YlmF
VSEPVEFSVRAISDVTPLAQQFCVGRDVVLVVSDADVDVARRALDYCNGLVAGRGKIDRVAEGRFLLEHDRSRRYRLERFYR